MPDRILLTARWVVGHENGRHCLIEDGEVVLEGGQVVFVGQDFPGEVGERHDYGLALLGPGLIDLDALADLDTTVLGLDNQPPAQKGRIWPRSYVERGPYEMYSPEELAFQKRYAFAQLLRHGATTALPISSLFYRVWGETAEEFAAAADAAAELGLRVYLGPAYRSGGLVVEDDGSIAPLFDEASGLAGLDDAIRFCRDWEGRHNGLVRTMLAPDRIETCTPELLGRTADAARELQVPVRLHCCQSRLEYELVLELRGMSPPEWLDSMGFLSHRTLLPHATWVSGSRGVTRPGRDLEIMRDAGATVVHCPIVSARGGRALESFARCRAMGIRTGLGTDTWPPDLVANMQAGLMLCRVVEGTPGAVSAADFYDAATISGADALGRPDLGRLAPGAAADLAVFDLSDGYMVPGLDPVQALLAGGAARYARAVWVAGRLVAERGELPGFDMDRASARAQIQFARLVGRYPDRTWQHPRVEEIFASSYPRHTRHSKPTTAVGPAQPADAGRV
jgi:cytosine/adenosine deaminase-related metal-dependent hydrolase